MSSAYRYVLGAKHAADDEHGSVNQSAPAWVLTFVRWGVRDTLRTTSADPLLTREHLVVENDCISVSTTNNKNSHTPSMSAVLVMTDVNYLTAVAPGDFVIVNMLNWDKDARRVADAARAGQAINGVNDGFKGIFKVQSVRRMLTVGPNGEKAVAFRINGFAFTEFNNTIYFNPYMISEQDKKNTLLFITQLGSDWALKVTDKGFNSPDQIILFLIQSFIGAGVSGQGQSDKNGTLKSANVHFFMPRMVGNLLNLTNVTAAKDIYNLLFGVQTYGGSGTNAGTTGPSPSAMNPAGITSDDGIVYNTGNPCEGRSLLATEFWNQVNAWSILQQYLNSPLNEMYTTFRLTPDGDVSPTLVLRQIPFTTEDFDGGLLTTKFLNLPRWVISPGLVTALDIGRDESARINFVQVFGGSVVTNSNGGSFSSEIAMGNYVFDINDVQRSGLRPYVVNSQMDPLTSVAAVPLKSPEWAKIIGDSLIGGHLKMNGTIEMVGVVEPIPVGDNVEFDGIVYHIESITHTCGITGNGQRTFRTQLALSSGVSPDSSQDGTRYAEMTHSGGVEFLEGQKKNHPEIFPGISESQDTVYRPDALDLPLAGDLGFTQPNKASTD